MVSLAVRTGAAQRQSQKPKVTDTCDTILPKDAFFS